MWGNPLLSSSRGRDFSAISRFWDSACLHSFLLYWYLFLSFSIPVNSWASFPLISVWRNVRPDNIHLKSFLNCKLFWSLNLGLSPKQVPFFHCTGLSRLWLLGLQFLCCFSSSSLQVHTKQSLLDLTLVWKIRSWPVWLLGTPLLLSVENCTIFTAP